MKDFNLKKILLYLPIYLGVALVSAYFFKLAPLIVFSVILFFTLTLIIFKNPLYGIILVAFLLPFERIGSFDVLGITVRASQIFSFIILIAWLFIFFVKKKNFNAENPTIIPILLFLGINIISMINSQNIERSILVFVFTLFTVSISIIIPNIINTEKKLDLVIKIILISCFIVSIFGIYQFIGDVVGLPSSMTGLREHYTKQVFGFPRVHSTALEPLYFANYLLIPISLALVFFLSKNNKRMPFNTFWMFVILGAGSLNLILTLSRGGFIGFAVVIFLSAIFFIKSIFSPKKIILLFLVLIIAASSAYGFLLFTGKEKNIDVFLEQATSYSGGVGVIERFSTYKEAERMMREYPIIGGGIGNFGPYASRDPYFVPADGWAIVNNEFLEIWAESGILGLIAFLSLLAVLFFRTIKALRVKNASPYIRTIMIGIFIAFLAIMVQYQTFSTLYILHIWFLIGLMVSVQNMLLKENSNKIEQADK